MKKVFKFTIGAISLFVLLCGTGVAQDFPFDPKTDTVLTIDLNTPPALLWVVDSNGARTGADPNLPVDSVGKQESTYPNGGLNEIPNSQSRQTNIEDNEDGEPSPETFWENDFIVTSPQVYTVNLKGITDGIAHFRVVGFVPHQHANFSNVNILLQAGMTRQVTVNFDTQQNTMSVDEVVAPGDLLNDVKLACSQGFIDHEGCHRLEDLAKDITDSINDKHYERAEKLLDQFIDSLGMGRDDDDRRHPKKDESASEMALKSLKNEAKTILKSLPDNDHHHH